MKKTRIFALFLILGALAVLVSSNLSIVQEGDSVCDLVLSCDGDCNKVCYEYEQCLPYVQDGVEYACVVNSEMGLSGESGSLINYGGDNGQGKI